MLRSTGLGLVVACLGALCGCSGPDEAAAAAPLPGDERHAVRTLPVPGAAELSTGRLDAAGRPVAVSCQTCHSQRPSDPTARTTRPPERFHQELRFAHGDLACAACHAPPGYGSLRLADGTALPYADVMQLCSQCHGPQTRDYAHGAHGGMSGHWDLRRGARVRAQCTHCHDPHRPAFPRMRPRFKPKDRFLSPHAGQEGQPR